MLARIWLLAFICSLSIGFAHAAKDDRDSAVQVLRLLDGDTDPVIAALPNGFDPRQEVFSGFTLLAVAAIADNAVQVQKLVAAGLDPKVDTSALEVSAQYGAANAFAVLVDIVKPSSNALDDLAYKAVNGYYVLTGARNLLRMAAEQVRDGLPPDAQSGPCFWELLNELTGPRVASESDGHIKILDISKARGASLGVIPGVNKTFKAFTLEAGEIYLHRAILRLNNELNTFSVDAAIAASLQNGNGPSLAYIRSLSPDRFASLQRVNLLEQHIENITSETFLLLSEPDTSLPQDLAGKLLTRFATEKSPNALARLLSLGVNIQQDASKLLRLASQAGSIENVHLLIAAGTAPNAASPDGSFVLQGLANSVIEARQGSILDKCGADRRRSRLLEVTRMLIERGAPLLANESGALVINEFLDRNYLDGDFIDLLTPTDSSRSGALVSSAGAGNMDFVRWFVETRGVSVKTIDATGRSVLQAAFAGPGARTVAPYILQRMDSAEGAFDSSSIIEALEFFFSLKCDPCVEKLLATAADLNRESESGSLFINTVLRAGDLQVASKLLGLGASPVLQDKRAERAIDFLCRLAPLGQKDSTAFRRLFAEILLENNVDLRGVTYGGRSILFDCFLRSLRDEVILDKVLLLSGEIIETALVEYAVERFGRIELEWLKRHQVNLAGKTSDGTPFLSLAIRSNNTAAFSMLLEQVSLDIGATDSGGETAIRLAFRLGRAKMARILQTAGATLPQDVKGLAGIAGHDNDLADVVLLDLLSAQLLAEIPRGDDALAILVTRLESANSTPISVESWSFEAEPPWLGLAPYTPPSKLAVTADVPFVNPEIGVSLLTSLSSHRYAGIAQSKNTEPRGLCMPPNICYQGICGFCGLYTYRVSTRFTLPSCVPQPANECLSTSRIENDATSGGVLTVTQVNKPSVSLSPGSSVLLERAAGSIDVKVDVSGTTFYTRFFAGFDALPEWPAKPAVYSSERLPLYIRALGFLELISNASDQAYLSTDSAIVAHRYWSAKMAQARYAEVAAEKLRRDLAAVESVPTIFDSLFESLADIEALGEVQLPVLAQQVRSLAEVMEGSLRDRLQALSGELTSAAGTANQATARLLEVRDELLAHHRTLADSLRLNLLEYLQFGDRLEKSPLKQMSSANRQAALARLSRKPGERVSDKWRAQDIALSERIQSGK